MFLDAFWIVLSAAVVLIATTVSARGPRPRGWLLVVAGGVVLAGYGFLARIPYPGYLSVLHSYGTFGYGSVVTYAVVLAAAALALAGVIRLEPAVRRRAVAATVPVAAVFPLVSFGFGGLIDFNMRHPDDIQLLGPLQWAALLVVPAAAFWVAAGLNRRLERSRTPAATAAEPAFATTVEPAAATAAEPAAPEGSGQA